MSGQQGDVYLFQTPDNGDIEVKDGIVTTVGGLATAVYLSILGGNEDDDGLQQNLLTWWGNVDETEQDRKYISETQNLLRGLPAVSRNLILVEEAVKRDLKWMLDNKVASNIDVFASIPEVGRISIDVDIIAEGNRETFNFTENWQADYEGVGFQRVESSPSVIIPPPPPTAEYNTFGFNGTDKYGTIANSAGANVGTGDATFYLAAAIVKNGATQMMFNKGAGSYPNYDFYIDNSGVIYCRLEVNASNNYAWITNDSADYADGVFRSYTWDTNRANNQPILYINGVSVPMVSANSSGTVATGDITTSAPLNIGRRDLAGQYLYMSGSMTEFFKFNRSLTAEEALNLHNLGVRPYYESLPTSLTDDADIAIEFSSRDNSGTDLSGNGNDVTFFNGLTDDGELQTFGDYSA